MSLLLKLRLQSLATLSRQIRKTERHALTHTQLLRIEDRLRGEGIPKRQMARIMKRASRRTIRRIRDGAVRVGNDIIVSGSPVNPEWITEADSARSGLHTLRTTYLRRELRAGYLAYAFLRDISFDAVEWHADEPVPLDRIEELVNEYTATERRQIVAQRFAEWAERVQVSIDEGRHIRPTQNPSVRERRREKELSMRTGW